MRNFLIVMACALVSNVTMCTQTVVENASDKKITVNTVNFLYQPWKTTGTYTIEPGRSVRFVHNKGTGIATKTFGKEVIGTDETGPSILIVIHKDGSYSRTRHTFIYRIRNNTGELIRVSFKYEGKKWDAQYGVDIENGKEKIMTSGTCLDHIKMEALTPSYDLIPNSPKNWTEKKGDDGCSFKDWYIQMKKEKSGRIRYTATNIEPEMHSIKPGEAKAG